MGKRFTKRLQCDYNKNNITYNITTSQHNNKKKKFPHFLYINSCHTECNLYINLHFDIFHAISIFNHTQNFIAEIVK